MAQTPVLDVTGGGAAPREAPPPAELPRRPLWRSLLERREAAILIVAVALFVYFSIASANFFSVSDIQNLSQFVGPIAVIGAGEVLLLVCAEVDLSAGTVFIFIPFVVNYLAGAGLPLIVAILLSLVVAGLIGVINGVITTWLNIPSFVTTLGTLFALDGVMLTTSNAQQLTMPGQSSAIGKVLGIYVWSEILWSLAIVAVMYVVLNRSRFGMHVTATGGNLTGAAEAGIPVNRVKIWAFVVCSVLSAFIGIIDAMRINVLDPGTDGTQEMFYAIAAAVIGGTALTGGRGTVIGALVGAIVLGVLYVGLTIIGISANTFILILGAAILLAMIANVQLAKLTVQRKAPT
jgi:simple sugar transport system permease protein